VEEEEREVEECGGGGGEEPVEDCDGVVAVEDLRPLFVALSLSSF